MKRVHDWVGDNILSSKVVSVSLHYIMTVLHYGLVGLYLLEN